MPGDGSENKPCTHAGTRQRAPTKREILSQTEYLTKNILPMIRVVCVDAASAVVSRCFCTARDVRSTCRDERELTKVALGAIPPCFSAVSVPSGFSNPQQEKNRFINSGPSGFAEKQSLQKESQTNLEYPKRLRDK